jgi:hypothetical protein
MISARIAASQRTTSSTGVWARAIGVAHSAASSMHAAER